MFMYLKFDFSGYEMSCMRCWLPPNSINSVIYQDLSSFHVHIELSHLSSFQVYIESRKKIVVRKSLESFDTGIVKK